MSREDIQARIQLPPSWKERIGPEFEKEYMLNLRQFLIREKQAGKIIYPESANIFNAMNLLPFEQVKVVIIGQDPYHGPKQAHGLCFSVLPGVKIPPSLRNIYKEIENDLGIKPANHGSLTSWAEQGVLLLNSVLTVESTRAASHQRKGWERFTDRIIQQLAEERTGLVFLLWGSYAQKKGAFIDSGKHLILQSVHPSPLSASRGFFGKHHFSKTNDYLKKHSKEPINWEIPPLD